MIFSAAPAPGRGVKQLRRNCGIIAPAMSTIIHTVAPAHLAISVAVSRPSGSERRGRRIMPLSHAVGRERGQGKL